MYKCILNILLFEYIREYIGYWNNIYFFFMYKKHNIWNISYFFKIDIKQQLLKTDFVASTKRTNTPVFIGTVNILKAA